MRNFWLQRYDRWLDLQYGITQFVAPYPDPVPPVMPPTQVPTQVPRPRPPSPTRPRLRLVVCNAALALALFTSSACAAAGKGRASPAARECYTAEQLFNVMRRVVQHPLIIGVVGVNDDFVSHYAFFVSELTSNWTLVEVKQKDRACVIARGIYWDTFIRDQE